MYFPLETEVITPLVSYSTFSQFEEALRDSLERESRGLFAQDHTEVDRLVLDANSLFERGYPPIVSSRAFSLLLGVSPRLVTAMTRSPELYWRTFEIKKRSGKLRQIAAPRVFLKTVQRLLLKTVLERLTIHPNAFGFAPGRGIVAHAQLHVRAKFVLTFDIADFFPSIRWSQVEEVFSSVGFPARVPALLADLCTRNKMFPQGAPTSPYLSNLIFAPTDAVLTQIASSAGMTYSRYADDLTFSSNSRPSKDVTVAIEVAIRKAGFRLQRSKTRLKGPTEAREVTGLIINEKVRAPRVLRRLLRAKFHRLEVIGTDSPESLSVLQGWASYVNSYDPITGRKYLETVREQRSKE